MEPFQHATYRAGGLSNYVTDGADRAVIQLALEVKGQNVADEQLIVTIQAACPNLAFAGWDLIGCQP